MTPQAALRALGAAARGLRIERRLHVAPGKRSYLAVRRGERFVLRVDKPDAPDLGLDRCAEARVLRAVCAAGVGPALVACRLEAPAVLLLRYAPGRAWTAADLQHPRRLAQLAELLREVHAVDATGLPQLGLAAAAARYARIAARADRRDVGATPVATGTSRLAPLPQGKPTADRRGVGATPVATGTSRLAPLPQGKPTADRRDVGATPVATGTSRLAPLPQGKPTADRRDVGATPVATGTSRLAPLPQGKPTADRRGVGATPVATLVSQVGALLADAQDPAVPPALCHNDPIAANVVGLRHPLLIDWEYAAVGDPLFDLAVIVEHHRLRARSARRLLAEYFGSAGAIPGDRLAYYRAVYRRILRLWQLALLEPARR